jgi:anti-sigma factor RsiW
MVGSRDGELAPAEAAGLQAHLAACPGCRRFVAEVAATDGLVAEALLAAAARRDFAPFVDGVLARVAADRPLGWLGRARRAVRLHPRLVAGALVPLLAAAAVAVYVQSRSGNEVADVQSLELNSEGHTTTIIQSSDGPVLLLDDDDDSET